VYSNTAFNQIENFPAMTNGAILLIIELAPSMEEEKEEEEEEEEEELQCGPMPNVMVVLPNIGGALCSTPQSLADAHY